MQKCFVNGKNGSDLTYIIYFCFFFSLSVLLTNSSNIFLVTCSMAYPLLDAGDTVESGACFLA